MKRNSTRVNPTGPSPLGGLGKITPNVKPIVLPNNVPEAITVKTLAEHFNVKPLAIRKILRAIGVKPSKVAVPDGWKNQARNQYYWSSNADPELAMVVAEIQKRLSE